MKKEYEAKLANLEEVLKFVGDQLDSVGAPSKIGVVMGVAVEELFVNIAHYAYGADDVGGPSWIDVDVTNTSISVKLIDEGTPFDPVAKRDPDITLSAEEREIGGLGILMVKKSMDEFFYEYKDGKNVTTIIKKW